MHPPAKEPADLLFVLHLYERAVQPVLAVLVHVLEAAQTPAAVGPTGKWVARYNLALHTGDTYSKVQALVYDILPPATAIGRFSEAGLHE